MGRRIRHTVAEWSGHRSLSARLSWFVALIVIGVVASVAYVEVRALEGHLDRDLVSAARLGAQSAAETLAERAPPLDPADVRDTLHDLVEADPAIDAISVVESDAGRPGIFTSTSTEERAEALDLAGRAMAAQASATGRSGTVVMVALPVPRRETYAVVVTVGLESLLQARTHGLYAALGFAVPTILLVTILTHFMVRRLVGQPISAIVRAMRATAEGNVLARAPVFRRDELGAIAIRLNEMLDQLQRLNSSLLERVTETARDLSLRSTELAASQDQLIAVRASLAGAERLAALGQLAANVAHQAGTPLNLVSGYVQMIRDDPRTEERIRSRLRTVDTQIQEVARVLRTMLDHARTPSGLEPVALIDIVDRVREVAQPLLSRSRVDLKVSVPTHLPVIHADATQLEMALLNLVTNALDAMPGGGSLSITAIAIAEGIRVEVADTGPGIPRQISDRLFEPWVTTKPRGQGSGLGLAIVRDVVRAHGGSIGVHSAPTGAVFVIELPVSGSPMMSS